MRNNDAMNAEEMIESVLSKVEGAERGRLEQALEDQPEQAARARRIAASRWSAAGRWVVV